jgi:surface protein
MDAMFYGCSGLTSLDVSSFNTSNVVSMSRAVDSVFYQNAPDGHSIPEYNKYILLGMFAGCSSLTSLDLSSFNTSKVTDMRGLFQGCKNLTSLNVSSFNTSNVQHMDAMFKGCSSLTSLDLSNFNTSNVVSMGYYVRVFSNSGSWGQLQHSGYDWDGGMFMNCSGLTSLNLSSFNTSKVTNMCKMFCNCKQLTFLDLSNFDMTLVDRNKKLDMCSGLSTTSRACTIVCTESVQNSLLEYFQYIAQYEEDEDVFYYYTDIPVDEVTFTWVRP